MPRLSPLIVLVAISLTSVAQAAPIKIAVVAPQSGNLEILGKQVLAGARLAAHADVEIVAVDESCADGSGLAIADAIASSGAVAAVGFLCTESLEGALPALASRNIPAITLSVRASILMEDARKKNWPFFRLAPSPVAEREKITDSIFQNWKGQPFAILDDGTITSRETAETVREMLEQKGMKATFVDTYRPAQEVQTQLLRRLINAGVSHVFAAADRADIAVMAHDAVKLKQSMVFLGGDALNASDQAIPLEKGVLAVTTPDYQTLAAAKSLTYALAKKDEVAEGYVLPANAAVTIVAEAQEIAAGSGASLTEALVDTPFETAIGTVTFNKAHELADNPFALLEWNGTAFVPPAVTE